MRAVKLTFLVPAILCLLFDGCGGGSSSGGNPEETTTDLSKIGCTWTDSNNTDYICVDTDGNLATLSDGVITTKSSAGESLTVCYGSDGLPTKMIIGDEVFVYEWDTANATVDLAFIDADNSITLQRGISVSADDLSAISQLVSSVSAAPVNADMSAKGWEEIREDPWWYIGKAVGIITCPVALGAAYVSAGTSEIVLAGQGVLVTCGLLVVGTAYEQTIASDIAPEGEYVEIAIDAIQCPSDVTGCIQAGAGLLSVVTEDADARVVEVAQEITSAEASLEGGGGAVKATLLWTEAVDLDLHVTDPNGEEIYYSHSTSASGGVLDVDDTDGGVENIYWSSNAPEGTYTVEVVYYSGSGDVDYTISVYKDDVLYGGLHTGTLTTPNPSTKTAVTTFTYP